MKFSQSCLSALKKRGLLFLLSLTFFLTLPAQRDIDSLFIAAPREVLPVLTLNQRLDMLDLFNYGMEAKVMNIFDGKSVLVEKNERELRVKLTESSEVQVFLFEHKADTLVGVVRTVFIPDTLSRLSVYTSDWKPVSNGFQPGLNDFLRQKRSAALPEEWQDWQAEVTVGMRWDAGRRSLVCTPIFSSLSLEARKSIQPFVCSEKAFAASDFLK